jgi:hypothetical protein
MNKWEEKIKQHEAEYHPQYAEIVRATKAWIEANHNIRSNPCGWKSCHGHKEDPIWAEYYRLRDIYEKAYSKLWMATDVTYGEDELTHVAWEWRYWKVMAQKCCHYQKSILTDGMAAKTMSSLHNAEENLMVACGLSEFYKSPCDYIEATFPKLKLS